MAGFCVKQTAIFDIGAFLAIHGLHHCYWRKSNEVLEKPSTAPAISWIGELGWIALGSGTVVAGSVAYFAAHGSLREAFYGTFLDAFIYATGNGIDNTLSRYANTFASEMTFLSQMHWIILASLAASYGCLFVHRQDWRLRFFGLASFIWVIFVLVGIVSIGRFYHHYFIQLVGPLSMACAYWAAVVPTRWRGFAVSASVLLYALAVSQLKINSFISDPENNISDIRSVTRFVRENTHPGDTLFCYKNSALCLYFLTERFPPTKTFMDAQMLSENKDGRMLLEDGLRRWKTQPPKYIVTGSLEYKIPEIDEIIARDFVACTNIGVFRIFRPIIGGLTEGRNESNE
jgi:hypothetical protein